MRYRRRYRKQKSFYGKYKHTINTLLLAMGVSYYMPKEWYQWNLFSNLMNGKK